MMDYMTFCKQLSLEAGELIRKGFAHSGTVQYKSDNTDVTEFDKRINKLVINRVKEHYPTHNVLGEEESFMENNSSFVWVVDPIDGTSNFIRGVPMVMFSLALVQDGNPIVACAYHPLFDEYFYTETGKPTTKNDKVIRVNDHSDLYHSSIATDGAMPRSLAKLDFIKMCANCSVVIYKCAVYEGCLIAQGSLHGYVFVYDSAHDVAAIKLLVENAGGKVTDLEGNSQRYDRKVNGCILSNGVLHDQLVTLVKQIRLQ